VEVITINYNFLKWFRNLGPALFFYYKAKIAVSKFVDSCVIFDLFTNINTSHIPYR